MKRIAPLLLYLLVLALASVLVACATGLIESYKGKPEIIARTGDQLEAR